MSKIISFFEASQKKQQQISDFHFMQLLEMKMNDSLVNIEEYQFLSFRDSDLMGIESFEIISVEDELLSKQSIC